ncbi:MAG: hypothetical protein JWN03_2779 [Nocardia sp.]|nr:hypothetical protein [Nocardia sp.]MCU1642504.1 hypothetical protein [Nocardia sp.]
MGRVYLSTVAVGAIAAFVMSMFSSVALLGFFGFGTLAILGVDGLACLSRRPLA